ncbi:MAG: ectoine/hydroxyectoine ABC transporter substrate-binding protein EhuB [Coriobacteriia bacterium]|jgi:polar amino acid transport system substrate-binding protein|nr:ectoine/hydroxyectoine ABC transporter substrate-binding protein EhuB [Coriobacteriia bacterium]
MRRFLGEGGGGRLRTLLVLSIVLALATAVGCAETAVEEPDEGTPPPVVEEEETTLDRIKSEGVVRVGFANEAPYAYSTPDGKLAGFMPATMEYIFSQIGDIRLEGVLTEFSGLIPGLQAGRFDCVGAGLYINAERAEQAIPANPQYTAAEGMAVLAGNPKGITGYADLLKDGVKFGTVSGSINLQYATDAGVAEGDVVLFPDVPSALAGLEAGRVDAIGMSVISLRDAMTKSGTTKIVIADPFTAPEGANAYGAVYFALGDEELAELYNAELAKAVESGKILEILEAQGFGKEMLPPEGVTSQDLIK